MSTMMTNSSTANKALEVESPTALRLNLVCAKFPASTSAAASGARRAKSISTPAPH